MRLPAAALMMIGLTLSACQKSGPSGAFGAGEDRVFIIKQQEGNVYSIKANNKLLLTANLTGHVLSSDSGPFRITMEFADDWGSATMRLGAEQAEVKRLTEKEAEARIKKIELAKAKEEVAQLAKQLYVAQVSHFADKDSYTTDLAAAGFAPDACDGGNRGASPGPGWISGCRFATSVEEATGVGDGARLTAHIRGISDPVTGMEFVVQVVGLPDRAAFEPKELAAK